MNAELIISLALNVVLLAALIAAGYALWRSAPPDQQNTLVGTLLKVSESAAREAAHAALAELERRAAMTPNKFDDAAVKAARAALGEGNGQGQA